MSVKFTTFPTPLHNLFTGLWHIEGEEGKTAFGGVMMQGVAAEMVSGAGRAILGIILLALLVGLWACLWMEPSPVF